MMEIHDELDDHADDGAVIDYRERARAELDLIAQQAKQKLEEHGIDIGLFLLIPNSGSAILSFGTIADPPDDLWDRVSEIVEAIVRQTVGLDRVRCRPVQCATTSAEWTGGHRPVSMHAPAVPPAGAEAQ